jgi:hypothetical protein
VNINITRDDWWHYVREEYYKRIIIKFQTKKIANKLKILILTKKRVNGFLANLNLLPVTLMILRHELFLNYNYFL